MLARLPSSGLLNDAAQVFDLWGIDAFWISGRTTSPQRTRILQKFRDASEFSILVVSSVGVSGLNLQCANILVIMVCDAIHMSSHLIEELQDVLWSGQEDRQLIGRLQRRGQLKQVIIYRLIAWGTPDVYLNNISFTKEKMMDAFMSASPSAMRKCLVLAVDSLLSNIS